MTYDTTTFERETLYKEIWAEPVSTVSARYGLSDAGLRKICKRLGVPMPRLGYWSKVAAGKQPRVTPLPSVFQGDTRYVRRVYVDQDTPERDKRIAKLLTQHASAISIRAVIQPSLDSCHPLVRRTGKRMARRKSDSRHLLRANGGDVFEVAVSEPLKDRALRLLDAVLAAMLAAGGRLEPAGKDSEQLNIRILGEPIGMRIAETSRREERRLTPAEVAAKAKNPYFYFADRWVYTTTGKLKLTLLSEDQFNTYATLSDGSSSLIEDRNENIAAIILAKAAQRQVKKQMDGEDRMRREAAWAKQQELARTRDAEFDRLKVVEQETVKWRRAQELRAFANALENSIAGSNDARAEQVAWIRNAADWLDPTVKKYWPAVQV